MAKSKNNVLTYGLSGTMGELMVFSQRNGQTIVGNKPKERIGPMSEKQLKALANFKKATVYGKGVVNNPAQKALYQAKVKRGETAYLLAVTDYLTAPILENPNLSAYTGQVGNKISVEAIDDFAVKSVNVSIKNAEGDLIEQGGAIKDPQNETLWVYTIKTANAVLAGTSFSFTAFDMPGNETRLLGSID